MSAAPTMVDEETGALIRPAFSLLVDHHLQLLQRTKRELIVLFATIAPRQASVGWAEAVSVVAKHCLATVRTTDFVGRVGPAHLALAFPDTSETMAERILWRLETKLKEGRAAGEFPKELTVDWRVAVGTPGGLATLDAMTAAVGLPKPLQAERPAPPSLSSVAA